MAKKGKPRGKTEARRTAEPQPNLSAPEGATNVEEQIAPELLPDGGQKIEPNVAPRREPEGEGDRDLSIRGILAFLAGIFGLLGVAVIASWALSTYLRQDLRAMDPPPSPIPEANRAELPPEPRLRESPPKDMAALRAREDAVLSTYGWVDRGAGIGRIPIDRAIELAAEGKTAAATKGQGDKP